MTYAVAVMGEDYIKDSMCETDGMDFFNCIDSGNGRADSENHSKSTMFNGLQEKTTDGLEWVGISPHY